MNDENARRINCTVVYCSLLTCSPGPEYPGFSSRTAKEKETLFSINYCCRDKDEEDSSEKYYQRTRSMFIVSSFCTFLYMEQNKESLTLDACVFYILE
jgi:hypothetical protein